MIFLREVTFMKIMRGIKYPNIRGGRGITVRPLPGGGVEVGVDDPDPGPGPSGPISAPQSGPVGGPISSAGDAGGPEDW